MTRRSVSLLSTILLCSCSLYDNRVGTTWLREATTYAETDAAYTTCQKLALAETPEVLFDQELDVLARSGQRIPHDDLGHSARYEAAASALLRNCMMSRGFNAAALRYCEDQSPLRGRDETPATTTGACLVKTQNLDLAAMR